MSEVNNTNIIDGDDQRKESIRSITTSVLSRFGSQLQQSVFSLHSDVDDKSYIYHQYRFSLLSDISRSLLMKIIASHRSETVKSISGSWKRWLILFLYFLLNAEMAFQVRSFGNFFPNFENCHANGLFQDVYVPANIKCYCRLL